MLNYDSSKEPKWLLRKAFLEDVPLGGKISDDTSEEQVLEARNAGVKKAL